MSRNGLQLLGSVALALTFVFGACSPDPARVGTNTNWMRLCNEDAECGTEYWCDCGRCTLSCADASDCPDGAVCTQGDAARIQCGGTERGTCQPTCETTEDCESGRFCLQGACTDSLPPLACPGDALYCTDFEDEWDEGLERVVTDGNELEHAPALTPSGEHVLSVSVADGYSTAYARAPLETIDSGEIYLSAWVGVPEPEAHNVAPLALWSAGEEDWALRLVVVDERVEVWTHTAPILPGFDLGEGSFHCLQMHVVVADAPDGQVTLSVDGMVRETAEEVDTLPERGIEAVAMGSLWSASAADFWVDRVVVSTAPIDCYQ